MIRPLAVNDQNSVSQRARRQRDANGKRTTPTPTPSPVLEPHTISVDIPRTNSSPNPSRSESDNKVVLSFNFPRMLPRVTVRLTQNRLAFLDSRLEDVSPSSHLKSLQDMKDFLSQGLSAIYKDTLRPIHLPHPTARLPGFFDMPLVHGTGKLPSHILSVADSETEHGQMYPIHDIVYGYQCPNFPFRQRELERPPPRPFRNTHHRLMMRLPVISLRVPHSSSFDLVNGFLYAHDPERLLLGLLPIAPSTNPTISEVRRTAERIAWSSDSKDLVVNAQFIHGFWRNVTALGIYDEVLWQTLELAWAVSIEAMACYQRMFQMS